QNLNARGTCTKPEMMMMVSISDAIRISGIDPSSPETIFVITSTKGNIELLSAPLRKIFEPDRIHLWKMAQVVTGFYQNPNKPVVISNACISGVVGILVAAEYIQKGKYKHAVVCGVDALSEFVVSGF